MLLWLKQYRAAASASRMADMMSYFALDPEIVTNGDPRVEAIMKEARERCWKCPATSVCEKWLVGKVKGRNTFCPNARTFRMLARTLTCEIDVGMLQAAPSNDRYISGLRSPFTPE